MILRVVLVVVGVAAVVVVLDAAIRTFVLPRASPVRLTRWVARLVTIAFQSIARPQHDYERRDRVMALYGPIVLLTLQAVWLVVALVAFAGIFVGIGDLPFGLAIRYSGSALLTLGFATAPSPSLVAITFIEAAIGLTLIAMLISYIPTIYGAFSRREIAVTQMSVRAGSPPTPRELLIRAHRAGYLHKLDDLFAQWELWFVELEETHTSLVILNFFRSPNPERSWVNAAGAVLDAAALRYAVVDTPFTPQAGICIRSGFLALRAIGGYFQVPFDPDPSPTDAISVRREEFDELCSELADAGVPLKTDRDAAWRDFAGWRVNYDTVLVGLGRVTMAPPAPWITDRS
jgi:hypothetical protein